MHQTIRPPNQFTDAPHAQSSQYASQLFAPGKEHVDNALGSPFELNQFHQFGVRRGNSSGTSPAAFTVVTTYTF